MKNILRARALKVEIRRLNPETDSRTIIRANAVYQLLNGNATASGLGKELGVSGSTVSKWKDKYLKDGIAELIKMKDIPINKPRRDTSNDIEHATRLEQELTNSNLQKHPNTKKRAEVILFVLKGLKTIKKAGEAIGVTETAVGDWIKIYIKEDFNALKNMEEKSLSKYRDTSKDKALVVELEEVLKDFDEENPLGKKQAEIILKIAKGQLTLEQASQAIEYKKKQ